jgi:phosphate/sulfate permease
VPIVASWFISPLMAALICLLFFVVLRWAVLRRANSTNMAFYVLPFLFVFTIWVNLFFVLVSVVLCVPKQCSSQLCKGGHPKAQEGRGDACWEEHGR